MSEAETLLAVQPRCRRHDWVRKVGPLSIDAKGSAHQEWSEEFCARCQILRNPITSKRGRNNRRRGNSHELSVARKYGGEKVGQLGLPEDIRGTEYRTQVKTHQRPAPTEWRKAFAALEAVTDGRTPRLIVRFLQPGLPADDYIIIKGSSWLDRFGRDEEEPNAA